MSEEMARKKKEEIEQLEKQEMADRIAQIEDKCPVCKLPTAKLEFMNVNLVKMFGWVECTRCGCVYSPKSVMKQKRIMASAGAPSIQTAIEPPPSMIVE